MLVLLLHGGQFRVQLSKGQEVSGDPPVFSFIHDVRSFLELLLGFPASSQDF